LAAAPYFPVVRLNSKTGLTCAVILILVVWFGNFLDYQRFTLYSDDWLFIGKFSETPKNFANFWDGLIHYPGRRIGQWCLIYLTMCVVDYFNSFQAGYLLLFLTTALATVTTWRALAYRFSNAVAMIAAILLAISPLVSMRPFLNGIAEPVSLTLVMVAGILYVQNRRIPAYIAAILALNCYELMFPLFVFLPILLRPIRGRADLVRFFVHAAICAVLLGLAALAIVSAPGGRLIGRIGATGLIDVAAGIVGAVMQSVATGLTGSVAIGRWLTKAASTPNAGLWGLFAFAAFLPILARLDRDPFDRSQEEPFAARPRLLAQTGVILALMTLAGYALVYFADTPIAGTTIGRVSRLHTAAAVPLSIAVALALIGVCRLARRYRAGGLGIGLAAVYLASAFALSVAYQDDFVLAAERQRLVVEQLAIDHPRMDPRATFIIRFEWLPPEQRQAIDYDDSHVWYELLRSLFDFSSDGATPTIRVFGGDGWKSFLSLGPDGRLHWSGPVYPLDPDEPGHMWYYQLSLDGVLTPLTDPVLVSGRNILHDGPDETETGIDLGARRKRRFYPLVMGRGDAILDAIERHAAAP
jgi:hypothetical protein